MESRKKVLKRLTALKSERSSWDSHWREISEVLLPRSSRFVVTDRDRGDKKHNKIYDNTAIRDLDALAAGLMAGMTSPARPWFRLTTSIAELDESPTVKSWLADVTRLMQMVFAKSNTYRALHSIYKELGAFGTAASLMMPDQKSIVHHYPFTIGEYAIAADYQGRVDTLYREFDMTVGQLVKEFGKENVSEKVRHAYEKENFDSWITVYHVIEPREIRERGKMDALNMPYKSLYVEAMCESDKVLRESGFKRFRAICPRWDVVANDIYGSSPAMNALGDIKQLQHEQLRKANAIDYQTKPPLQMPTSLKNQGINTLPGGVSYVDATFQGGGIRSAFEVNLNLQHLLLDIQDVRQRIHSAFYADLFMMLANSTNSQMTATEVAERHEEKMLMLGPVIERLHNEILEPLIENTFDSMVEAGIVPPAPPEMQGMDLNVEFISMLAQAQRAVGTNSIDRFVGNLGAVAGIKPDVLDKFDADKWADVYADSLGIDPELIVPGEKVALIRQARAEQAAQQQQAEQMALAVDAAAKMGSVNTSQPNMLSDATAAFSGY